MKFTITTATLLALQMEGSAAFTPSAFTKAPRTFSTQRSVIHDPSILADAHQHVDALTSFFSSITISDAVADVATAVASPEVADVAAAAPAAEAVATDNGWFGFLEGPIELILGSIHSTLVGMGMDADAWGLTIIAMTLAIKLATYPLTKQQLESTNKMQALQPTIKDLQAKYASNPEVMNQKIAEVYQTNQVNPLAGCIPSILQIPIFIGLYRAVLQLAKDNRLNEPFLFLPNLEGPTYGADPAHGSDWILSGWVNGAPSLGWEDTLAFLSIPIVLVLSQSLSMNLMATKDQEQPAVLKFLPLLIGWFSLNVPAALGIYWVANNFITTALTLQIRSSFNAATPVTPGSGGSTAAVVDVSPTTFTPAPIREKPSGFGAEESVNEINPITPMDAEVVAETKDAVSTPNVNQPRRSKKKSKKRGKKKN